MRGTLNPCPLALLELKVVNRSQQVYKQALLELPPYFRASLRIKPLYLDELKCVLSAYLKQKSIDEFAFIVFAATSYDEVLMRRPEYPPPTAILYTIAYFKSLRFDPAVYPLNGDPDYLDE
jgi:hypothetical protein